MHRIRLPIGSGRISGVLQKRSISQKNQDRFRFQTIVKNCPDVAPGVYLGIDADISGAVGVIDVEDNESASPSANVRVYDMPSVQEVINGKRKRRLDHEKALQIMSEVKSTSKTGKLLACLEAPLVFSSCGSLSRHLTGYIFGFWHGALLSHGVKVEVVRAVSWKRQLDLILKKKEGSLELARQLFPCSQSFLKRKKDHGRAEGLLLAAYCAGFRLEADEEFTTFQEAIAQSRIPNVV